MNDAQHTRICDLLEKVCARLDQVLEKMDAIKPFDPQAATNCYGENLTEGIQNAIARGQRGITTYG